MHNLNKDRNFRNEVNHLIDKAMKNDSAEESQNGAETGKEDYLNIFADGRNFREFVRGHVVRPKITPEFIQSIKDKVKIQG